jgi:hypothetical protein
LSVSYSRYAAGPKSARQSRSVGKKPGHRHIRLLRSRRERLRRRRATEVINLRRFN